MQFQVPQFIETEDKIIGPFSLRQFAYVGIGGIISALIYFIAQFWLWAIASFFIFVIAFGLAFVKIAGRPLMNIVISAFNFYWKPQTYIWQPAAKPIVHAEKKVAAEASKSALEDILAKSAAKVRPIVHPAVKAASVQSQPEAKPQPQPISREAARTGSVLHKNWEDLQTGAAFEKKNSDKQFLERKMAERYQIFKRISGDRNAARRVDYR